MAFMYFAIKFNRFICLCSETFFILINVKENAISIRVTFNITSITLWIICRPPIVNRGVFCVCRKRIVFDSVGLYTSAYHGLTNSYTRLYVNENDRILLNRLINHGKVGKLGEFWLESINNCFRSNKLFCDRF